ncbi:hypothetical protein CXU09_07635 [Akkermansia muciniphila]|uniref:Uncharacterized protein n=1 Tax=Akkermansia muciniphila TaxID=239935 RepID=A0AAP8NKG1_9BACT|nr:DUF3780 domain-containing protein [Akkermansia muciniphila]PNC55948.1 hypothetical protein CXU09_07635 [Akkermansia muciniphila]
MPEWIDFGAPAACGAHRFRLEIPQASRAAVALYEDMGFAGDGSRPEGALLRARVKRSCWSAVSALVMREFNERLQAGKQAPGRWRTGGVWLERMLGRELCVVVLGAGTRRLRRGGAAHGQRVAGVPSGGAAVAVRQNGSFRALGGRLPARLAQGAGADDGRGRSLRAPQAAGGRHRAWRGRRRADFFEA